MIWNKEILFLHVPKTGGMSVTEFLLENLRGPVTYTSDSKHPKGKRAKFVKGARHETLADAESYFTYKNQSIDDFEAIFAVMRNPYDLEVSRYAYLRQGLKVDRGPAQELALEGDFEAYLREAPFFGAFPPRLDRYFRLGGMIPPRMRILRNEQLEADLRTQLAPYLVKNHTVFPRANTSERDDWTAYYDEVSEELCYQRHHWFFDLGFYHRHLPAYAAPKLAPLPETEAERPPLFPPQVPTEIRATDPVQGKTSLTRQSKEALTRICVALGSDTPSTGRLLDIGGGAALSQQLAARRPRITTAGYLGLNPPSPLLDLLLEHVHIPGVGYGQLSLASGFVTASVGMTRNAFPIDQFDTVWIGKLTESLIPADLIALLRFCRSLSTGDATLIASVNLLETTENKVGLFDALVTSGFPEDLPSKKEFIRLGDIGLVLHTRTCLAGLVQASGWEVDEVYAPTAEIARSTLVCRAIG